MTILLLLVIIALLIYVIKDERRFKKILLFQIQEMHLRLSHKQDRLPRNRIIRDGVFKTLDPLSEVVED